MKINSLHIAIANPLSAGIVYLLLEFREFIPEWLVYPFYPFFMYSTLSVFISFGGIVIGLLALNKTDKRSIEIIGTVGNMIYFIWFVFLLKSIWPALMSV